VLSGTAPHLKTKYLKIDEIDQNLEMDNISSIWINILKNKSEIRQYIIR